MQTPFNFIAIKDLKYHIFILLVAARNTTPIVRIG